MVTLHSSIMIHIYWLYPISYPSGTAKILVGGRSLPSLLLIALNVTEINHEELMYTIVIYHTHKCPRPFVKYGSVLSLIITSWELKLLLPIPDSW